jgi:hypothetical protein
MNRFETPDLLPTQHIPKQRASVLARKDAVLLCEFYKVSSKAHPLLLYPGILLSLSPSVRLNRATSPKRPVSFASPPHGGFAYIAALPEGAPALL